MFTFNRPLALFIATLIVGCAAPEGQTSDDDLSVDADPMMAAAMDVEKSEFDLPESTSVASSPAGFTQDGIVYAPFAGGTAERGSTGVQACSEASKLRFRALLAHLPEESKGVVKQFPGLFSVAVRTLTEKDGEAALWRFAGETKAYWTSNYAEGVCTLPTRSLFVKAFTFSPGHSWGTCSSDANCVHGGVCDAKLNRCLPK